MRLAAPAVGEVRTMRSPSRAAMASGKAALIAVATSSSDTFSAFVLRRRGSSSTGGPPSTASWSLVDRA